MSGGKLLLLYLYLRDRASSQQQVNAMRPFRAPPGMPTGKLPGQLTWCFSCFNPVSWQAEVCRWCGVPWPGRCDWRYRENWEAQYAGGSGCLTHLVLMVVIVGAIIVLVAILAH